MSQTIEQRRAFYALESANTWATQGNDLAKFKTLTPKIPTMILQNGLGQTLSFILPMTVGDKPSHAADQLYQFMQNWLCGTARSEERPCIVYTSGDLIEQLISGSREDYMWAQQETLALFNWLKKFVEAKIDEQP